MFLDFLLGRGRNVLLPVANSKFQVFDVYHTQAICCGNQRSRTTTHRAFDDGENHLGFGPLPRSGWTCYPLLETGAGCFEGSRGNLSSPCFRPIFVCGVCADFPSRSRSLVLFFVASLVCKRIQKPAACSCLKEKAGEPLPWTTRKSRIWSCGNCSGTVG